MKISEFAPVLDAVSPEHAIRLTQDLGAIPSFSGSEAAAAQFLAARMRELGLEVILQEAEPKRPNVIGILRGTGGGPSLMFNGHLDVSPVPLTYRGDPFRPRIANDRIYGHGIRNMKGGVAAMVEAAAALARSGIRLRGDVIVAAVVGELQGGIGTVAMLDAGYVPEMAIVPEPTHLAIRTLQCGALDVLIHVRGRASASATRHLTPPVNALHKMLKIIPAIEQMRFTYTPHPELPHLPLVSIGGIVAGLGHEYKMHRFEYTPDYCTVTVGIRTAPGQSEASVRADLEAALAALRSADPDLQAEVAMPPAGYAAPFHGLKYFVPAPVVPKEAPVVAALARAHETVSGKPVDHIGALIPNSYFYCDAGHLFARGAQAVSYGPAGHAFDPVHEGNVSIPNLVTCTRALALAACHLCA